MINHHPNQQQPMTRAMTSLFAFLSLVLLLEFLSTSAVGGSPQRARRTKRPDAWRKHPPKSDAPRPFTLPAVRETRYENGLTVLFVEDHRSPVVTILVGMPPASAPSGGIAELTNQMALSEAAAELITEGAGSRTSEQVAREVETLGGRLSSSANDDYAEVSLSVVAENAERMMDLLGDPRGPASRPRVSGRRAIRSNRVWLTPLRNIRSDARVD